MNTLNRIRSAMMIPVAAFVIGGGCSTPDDEPGEETRAAAFEERRQAWLDKMQSATTVTGGRIFSGAIEAEPPGEKPNAEMPENPFPVYRSAEPARPAQPASMPPLKLDGNDRLNAQLTFNSAPLVDVAAAFSELLGFDYVIDSALSGGTVTMTLNGRLTRRELWNIFKQIVTLSNGYLSYDNKLVQLRPTALLPQSGTVDPAVSEIELGVFKLHNIDAKQAADHVGMFLSQGVKAVAAEEQNTLLVLDAKATVAKIRILLEQLDVPGRGNWYKVVVPCGNVSADRLAGELAEILPVLGFPVAMNDEKSAPGAIHLTSLPRLQIIVASAANREALDELGRWAAALDRDDIGDQERIFVYDILNGNAPELVEALSVMFPVEGSTMKAGKDDINTIDATTLSSQPTAKPAAASGNGRKNIDGPSSVFDEPVKVFADAVHNRLLIRTKPRAYTMIKAMLDRLDSIPAQVLLQVLVVEVTLNDSVKFGVEFMMNSDKGSVENTGGVDYKNLAPGAEEQYGAKYWIFNPNNKDEKYAYINALAGKTNVKVISSPQVLVISHDEAEISVGDKVPIVNSEITNTQSIITGDKNASTNLVRNIQYQDTGIILKITPHVTRGGRITMKLDQTVSEAIVNKTSSLDSPQIQERKLKSSMSIRDGQTVICGGIIREKYTDNLDTVPIIANIPFLRRLIGDTDVSTQRTEMLILVSGTIVSEESRLEELLKRYRQSVESIMDFTDPESKPAASGKNSGNVQSWLFK